MCVKQCSWFGFRFGFQLQPGTLEQFCKGGNDGKYCHVTCKARSIDGKSDELPILLLGEEEPTSISILPRHAENMFYLNNNVTIECSAAFKDFICKWIKPKVILKILNEGCEAFIIICLICVGL